MVITMKNKIGLTKIYLTTVLLLSINQTYADQGNKVKIKENQTNYSTEQLASLSSVAKSMMKDGEPFTISMSGNNIIYQSSGAKKCQFNIDNKTENLTLAIQKMNCS